jgi:hypothetical protein
MKVQSSAIGLAILLTTAASVSAATTVRIMPPDGATLAAGQRFDLRVEATSDSGQRPAGLRVFVNGRDLTSRSDRRAGEGAPDNAAAFLVRGFSFDVAGAVVVRAETKAGPRRALPGTVVPATPHRTATHSRGIRPQTCLSRPPALGHGSSPVSTRTPTSSSSCCARRREATTGKQSEVASFTEFDRCSRRRIYPPITPIAPIHSCEEAGSCSNRGNLQWMLLRFVPPLSSRVSDRRRGAGYAVGHNCR